MYRIGFGYDVHRLEEGLDLYIGGIKLEHNKGIVAHSDGDVLIHAICDALLGALALGDIGTHFPDTSAEFENIDSKVLLSRVVELVNGKGYRVVNIDCMLTLERPKIKPHVAKMQEVLAQIIGVAISDVSVKATTREKLGFVGREEGVEAFCNALLCRGDF